MLDFVNLEDVCEIVAGQSPPSSTYNKDANGLPFFQGKADFGELYPKTRMWCSEPKKVSLPNDILISVRAPVGPTNINNVESCIGRGLSAIRCSDNIALRYLLHFLRFNEKRIADKGSGSTFKAITQKELKIIQVPLPPLPVQQKIASILDAADALKQKDKALIAKYDELTQSLFWDMFGDPVTNPMKWHVVKLNDVLELITYGLTVRPEYHKEGIPLISAKEIRSGKVDYKGCPKISSEDFQNLTEKGKPQKDDILFSKTGSIGHCALIEEEISFAISQNAARMKFSSEVNPKYALFYLRTPFIQTLAKHRAKGNAVKDLQLGEMKKFNFIKPPVTLQSQFAERIEAIEKQKQQAQSSLQKSQDLFNCLLQKAFKGELVT